MILQEIQQLSGLSEKLFDALYRPLINEYAKLVQLFQRTPKPVRGIGQSRVSSCNVGAATIGRRGRG